MTITTVTLAGTASTTIADLVITAVRRQATPTVRDIYVDVPGRPGAWHFGEAAGDREITLGLLIAADSLADRRSTVRAVGRWLWPAYGEDGERQLVLDDEPDRYELVTLAESVDVDELLETAQGSATFRAAPFAFAATEDTANLTLSPGSPVEIVTVSPSVDLANELPVVVDVTAQADLTGGFSLSLAGAELTYSADVLSGSTVTIDTDTLTVSHDGAAALTATTGAFGKFTAGDNTVEWVAGSGGALVDVTWRRRYV